MKKEKLVMEKEVNVDGIPSDLNLNVNPAIEDATDKFRYRFHFHAERCIGCSSCVVACNEQYNNDVNTRWRKVSEVEWGEYPHTGRIFLSMACNHCEDPSCLKGCPTNSYTRDAATGIILHNQSTCIGCQYCTWNCPYSAPLYNPDFGIVTKCNMCHDRLKEGDSPACAESCPVDAIVIEKISYRELNEDKIAGVLDAPGLPESTISGSTTKITLPEGVNFFNTRDSGTRVLKEEHHHSSLIFFLTLSQLAVGVALMNWICGNFFQMDSDPDHNQEFKSAAVVSASALLALFIAMFHLGRPLRAFRALKGLGHSWISREILFFSMFSFFALAQGVLIYWPGIFGNLFNNAGFFLGSLSVLSGILAVYSSAKIYIVPARPFWNTPATIFRFFASMFLLGSSSMAIIAQDMNYLSSELLNFMLIITMNAAFIQLLILMNLTAMNTRNSGVEFKEGLLLLKQKFAGLLVFRLSTLFTGGIVIPAFMNYLIINGKAIPEHTITFVWITFILILASELSGKFLFFVTSLPRKIAGGIYLK